MARSKIVLCDTNIMIDYFKGRPPVQETLRKIGYNNISISTITASELYHGARDKTELKTIKESLDDIIRIPINEFISDLFEELMLKHVLSHRLSVPDGLIAATSLYYEIPLYTLNKKDFRFINEIRLI